MPRKRPTPRLQPGLGVGEGGHGEGMGEAGDEALGRDAGDTKGCRHRPGSLRRGLGAGGAGDMSHAWPDPGSWGLKRLQGKL